MDESRVHSDRSGRVLQVLPRLASILERGGVGVHALGSCWRVGCRRSPTPTPKLGMVGLAGRKRNVWVWGRGPHNHSRVTQCRGVTLMATKCYSSHTYKAFLTLKFFGQNNQKMDRFWRSERVRTGPIGANAYLALGGTVPDCEKTHPLSQLASQVIQKWIVFGRLGARIQRFRSGRWAIAISI